MDHCSHFHSFGRVVANEFEKGIWIKSLVVKKSS